MYLLQNFDLFSMNFTKQLNTGGMSKWLIEYYIVTLTRLQKNHILYTKSSKILEPCKIIANETNEKITQYNFLTSI